VFKCRVTLNTTDFVQTSMASYWAFIYLLYRHKLFHSKNAAMTTG